MNDPLPAAQAVIEPVESAATPEAVLVLTAGGRDPAILETLCPAVICGRHSYFACDPLVVLTCLNQRDRRFPPLESLADKVARFPRTTGSTGPVPFSGGWIGFLSYEAGLVGKRVRLRAGKPADFPLLRFGLYDHLLAYDHERSEWYACAVDWPGGCRFRSSPAALRLERLRQRLRDAESLALTRPAEPSRSPWTASMTFDDYRRRVRRALDYIEAGDIYQVNLSQRFSGSTTASPLDVYRRLRRSNPASLSAYVQWGDTAVLSSSPELFLNLRGRHVITRPIKGTRPRTGDPRIDAVRQRELEMSEKERAELVMIVDLLRNDLGRVCEFGSIRVADPGCTEIHPTVFHRVATIQGRLFPQHDWPQLLGAAFPGGSVTGAPKLRAMQIIRELEPTPRDVYCGSIGWIGLDGNVSLSIAIRTMIQRGERVHAYAGGAIVAESDPAREFEEIQAKARGMLGALNAGPAIRSPALRRKRATVA